MVRDSAGLGGVQAGAVGAHDGGANAELMKWAAHPESVEKPRELLAVLRALIEGWEAVEGEPGGAPGNVAGVEAEKVEARAGVEHGRARS